MDVKIVKFDGLTKKFGDLVAVDNVNLSIEEGEIFGLLGPNGAGKSTMINILSGLLSMDKGTVEILGKDIRREAAFAKAHIGVVPQEIAIYEYLSAIENVEFFAGLYGLRGGTLKERAREALEFVGLSDKATGLPKEFSGGMKRRLNIACAIAHRPQLIIMDEPTVGIDPQSRNHILQSVKRFNAMGCTVIYTSHYMEEVEEICGRVAIIDHGKVIAEGTCDALKANISNVKALHVTVAIGHSVDPTQIKMIPGVLGVDVDENLVQISSSTDVENLDKIILYFTGSQIPIRAIESRTPDLETVFLTLTGRKLRD